ncbi:hypothetical protein M413DRAFT_443613 [Hebeloma cylindrosporum]|uniref:Uncharacterized protein n=1 Tax=Hebeloma cylindrosporum TaxID=76867 RepID=A0A0C3CJ24_HEBCY|nr:hypothetical protein M413DRAFT_443613 [Hebeloma cylindrosporum h7]
MPVPTVFPVPQPTRPFPVNLPLYVGAVLWETFLYGIYMILFAICIYILCNKKTSSWILLSSAIAMFALSSTDIAYTYYLVFGKLMKGKSIAVRELRPKFWLYITNNVLADSLLLYRCYVSWGSRKIVTIGPAILLVASTACGYLFKTSTRFQTIYMVMILILNITLTGLTAGRIWWLARKARLILGTGLLQRYNTSIAILIESGVIYSVYIIIALALLNNPGSTVNNTGLIQIVGIIPTLIIVQVGLGRAVYDTGAEDANSRPEPEADKNARSRESFLNAIKRESVPSSSRDSGHHVSGETVVISLVGHVQTSVKDPPSV